MEGIQTINALKAVQSSLPAQTTIPSDELVMLYAADGTPIAKIARDDLVKAVASVMASNSQTTFSKLLGVQANGTPMGIGASDLASVLGVIRRISTSNYNNDLNNMPEYSVCYASGNSVSNLPKANTSCFCLTLGGTSWDGVQIGFNVDGTIYNRVFEHGTPTNWSEK